ncbi:class I SAM-dependent DNA methyltransferase [Mycoplasmopsis felifaucium]|uniref:site-specific DNA-methyltransferase (adenine-specific) n=1 Tax=Mycoplasmopsis felifaucium TaxID=35768 RepID=A0ABZ2RRB8_9BACT
MTDLEIKKLKANLWHSADILRSGAHIAANKYGQPILGLIFLRYADILFKQHKAEIDAEFISKKDTRAERAYEDICIEKCGFYLPECAYFDFINDSADTAEKATLVKNAMEAIEEANPRLKGVFPKEVYGQLVPSEEPELLSRVIRVFKDIPENIEIDLFGEIYEFFLGEFALNEGKDGGAFYTPASVVKYMVEVINPESGEKMFLDPACGSGGMFVQAARYMHRHNKEADIMQFRCYGVEKEPDTVKLAKMNLILNNVRGEITEANSFYSNPYDATGKFDYVMANPPFNVDEVLYERVKDDSRFNAYGMTKGTKGKGKDAKETVSNANYLWISYFASALNDKGRAALVMANSASDSGGSDQIIRQNMIKVGIIKQMVALPSKMFTTVTLPATLWFFDKNKPENQKNKILFIDARNIFTQIDKSHRKFSEEQIKNLGLITRLYGGDENAYSELIGEYKFNKDNNVGLEDGKDANYWQSQIDWIKERFPEAKYRDIIGLCKVAEIGEVYNEKGEIIEIKEDSIADQDWSLNAGRYVGVVIEDDGLTEQEFKEQMFQLNKELKELNEKAHSLEEQIEVNLKSLFGE